MMSTRIGMRFHLDFVLRKTIEMHMRVVFLVCVFCGFLSCPADAQNRAEVRAGHSATITEVVYAPDGKTFATSSDDDTIKIWDASRKTEIRTLIDHTNQVFSIDYSPDGRYLLSSSADMTAKLWDSKTGAVVHSFQGNQKEYTSAKFMPDGQTIATLGIGVVRIWSMQDFRLLRSFKAPEVLGFSFRVSPDGHFFAWGGSDGKAYVMDADHGRLMWRFETRTRYCFAVAFSPDSRMVAVATDYEQVEIHDLRTGALVQTLRQDDSTRMAYDMSRPNAATLRQLAYSPDGRFLAAAGLRLYRWNAATGQRLEDDLSAGLPAAVAYSPDGGTLAIGQVGGGVGTRPSGERPKSRAGVVETPPRARTVAQGEFTKADANAIRPYVAAFAPDGRTLVTAGESKDLFEWDLATGKILRQLRLPIYGAWFVKYAPTGDALVVAGMEGVLVVDRQTGQITRKSDESFFASTRMSPDGRFLCTKWPNGLITVLDMASQSKHGFDLNGADVLNGGATSLTFVNNHIIAVGGADGTVSFWAASTGARQKRSVKAGSAYVTVLAPSPDGRMLAGATSDGGIYLWDLASGKRRQFRQPGGQVNSLAFTPDGQTLASVESGGPVVTRRVEDGQITGRYNGGDGQLGDITLSADGKLFSTVGGHSVTVWQAPGKAMASLYAFKDGSSVATTPQGYYDASSKDAEDNVSVRIGGALFPISAYREKFFRPDLVHLSLAGRSLTQLGFAGLGSVKLAPVVSLDDVPLAASTPTLAVSVKITDNGGGIGQVRLFLNGTAVVDDTSAPTAEAKGNVATRNYTIHLANGSNALSAIAFNADNSMQSSAAVASTYATLPVATRGSLHALVVGIQDFKNPDLTLKFSGSDARFFADTLTRYSAPLFDKVDVKLLTTPEETSRDAVIAALEAMRASVGPNDLFVFYVATHGLTDDGEYYLITSNVGSVSTESLKNDAITKEELTSLVANIPATKKLMVIDTCRAAALGDALSIGLATRGLDEATALKILSRAVGTTVLAASTSTQQAIEGYEGHGLFTYVVVQGLMGKGDVGKDGFVSTFGLAHYVNNQVPELAEQQFHRAQYPMAETSGQEFPVTKVQ